MEGLGAAAGGCSAGPEDTDSVLGAGSGIDAADLGMRRICYLHCFYIHACISLKPRVMRGSCATITRKLLHGLIYEVI